MRMSVAAAILAILVVFLEIPIAAGDGLAVGVTGESIGSIVGGGAVNVLYGDSGGLTDVGSQMWNQDTAGIPGMAEINDHFGEAIASGDFNGDGQGDLAIGVPGEGIDGQSNAGLVHVLFSDASGNLTADGNQWWYQGLNGLPGTPGLWVFFAYSLAAGDFDGDGFADLAIGVPYEDVGGFLYAGAVQVLYGSVSGLTSVGNQLWSQDSPGVRGNAEGGDKFGKSLAAGDFDGDGFADLAIGVSSEDVDANSDAGAVNVLYGSVDGLTADGDDLWTDPWGDQADAQFGLELAVGDLNGDGRDDLAVSAPWMELSGIFGAGTVTVLFGSVNGLSSDGFQTIAQGLSVQDWPVHGEQESWDHFGDALAIGDFNGDGWDDLAAAASDEDLGTIVDAGVVHILFGTATGLTGENNQLWHQNLSSVGDEAEPGDSFGEALAAGDFDSDGKDDLAVGVPWESFDFLENPGLVHIFYGGVDGPTSGLEVWSQDSDVPGGSEDWDQFGWPLAVIRSSFLDALFADGLETGDTTAWSSTAP